MKQTKPRDVTADEQQEIVRDGHAPWLFLFPLLLGMPGVLWALGCGEHGIAAGIVVLMMLLAKGTWNVVRYERDTPLLRIEGGSITWFGDFPKQRFTVALADIRSWRIDYVGMRKHPYYRMTVQTQAGVTIERVFSAVAVAKSADIYPLLERCLAQRFTPPFKTPAVN